MLRTGDDYRESIRDGREVWIGGERVADVTTHPAFRPLVDVRARIYDMAHDEATRDVMTSTDEATGEANAVAVILVMSREEAGEVIGAMRSVLERTDTSGRIAPAA